MCPALNRSVGKMHFLRKDADFEAFQHDVIEALSAIPSASFRIASCRITGTLSSGRN